MAIEQIGFGNFSKIAEQNLTLNLPTQSNEWIPTIIQTFNNTPFSNFVVLLVFFVFTFWELSDKTAFGMFRFSDPRASTIALAITVTFGVTFLEAGFFTSLKTVATFVIMFIISYIINLNVENKE